MSIVTIVLSRISSKPFDICSFDSVSNTICVVPEADTAPPETVSVELECSETDAVASTTKSPPLTDAVVAHALHEVAFSKRTVPPETVSVEWSVVRALMSSKVSAPFETEIELCDVKDGFAVPWNNTLPAESVSDDAVKLLTHVLSVHETSTLPDDTVMLDNELTCSDWPAEPATTSEPLETDTLEAEIDT